MVRDLKTSVVLLLAFTVVTGGIYPMLVTAISQFIFPAEARGSLIELDGRTLGSTLIGQPFSGAGCFQGHPSATTPFPYNAVPSAGSNQGPLNPSLLDAVGKRVRDSRRLDSLTRQPIPVDLVTASASGLDPHISVMGALYQLPRVAHARGLSVEEVRMLVEQETEGRQFGILGEPRVNVLLLNLALDQASRRSEGR